MNRPLARSNGWLGLDGAVGRPAGAMMVPGSPDVTENVPSWLWRFASSADWTWSCELRFCSSVLPGVAARSSSLSCWILSLTFVMEDRIEACRRAIASFVMLAR